jgi:hypothetical protein
MAYAPSSTAYHGGLTEVEAAGIKALIRRWSGVDIHLIDAGPCVSDPIGDNAHYISIRDHKGNAVAVGLASDGTILKVQENHADVRSKNV